MGSNPTGPASYNRISRTRPDSRGRDILSRDVAGATKKAKLLSDPNVKRWYDNLSSSSKSTAEVALRRLTRFCELAKMDQTSLARLEQKALEDLVQDIVRRLEKENKAPDYIGGIVKAVKSWLKHNERELKRDIKIKDLGVPVTLEEEHVPEPPELSEFLAAATTRGKVSISIMAFSGLRPQVLGNMEGTDGLVLGDFPDLDLETLTFKAMPAQLIIRSEISKVRHQYFSFLNEKGCGYLLTYLKERRNSGEILFKDSPIIRANVEHKVKSLRALGRDAEAFFICTGNIEEEIRRAIRRAGYQWRPYVLRSYFDSHLLNAELRGTISSEPRAFFMGLKGTIERKYTLNKHKLPRELFGAMRDQYLKASSFLTSESVSIESVEQKIEDARAETRRQVEEAKTETRKNVATEFEERLRNIEGLIQDMTKMAALGLKFTPEGIKEAPLMFAKPETRATILEHLEKLSTETNP